MDVRSEFDRPYSEAHTDHRLMDWYYPETPNGHAMLWIHGGGFSGGSKKQWRPVCNHFAALGYTCATAEYRLAPVGDMADQVADSRLAMQHMRDRATELGYRTDRIAAGGSSAGGHLVCMLGTIAADDSIGTDPELLRPDTRPNLVYAYCPVTCIYPGPPHFGYCSETVKGMLHGPPDDDRIDAYRAASPIDRIDAHSAPTLFIHGDADETVPLSHSTNFHRLLLEHDVASRLLVLTGVKHGFGYGVQSDSQLAAIDHVERYTRSLWD